MRPTKHDLVAGLWFVGLFLLVVVVYARTDPEAHRSDEWRYLGPAGFFAINLAWSHRTSGLVRLMAWAVAGGVAALGFLAAATAVGAYMRPWASNQPWLDAVIVASLAAGVAALVIANIVRQTTSRGRRIALAQGALLPVPILGLMIVAQLGPWTAIGILLALGGPIGMYWLDKQQSRDAEVSTLGPAGSEPVSG